MQFTEKKRKTIIRKEETLRNLRLSTMDAEKLDTLKETINNNNYNTVCREQCK